MNFERVSELFFELMRFIWDETSYPMEEVMNYYWCEAGVAAAAVAAAAAAAGWLWVAAEAAESWVRPWGCCAGTGWLCRIATTWTTTPISSDPPQRLRRKWVDTPPPDFAASRSLRRRFCSICTRGFFEILLPYSNSILTAIWAAGDRDSCSGILVISSESCSPLLTQYLLGKFS